MNSKKIKEMWSKPARKSGVIGNNMVLIIMVLLLIGGYTMIGGQLPASPQTAALTPSVTQVVVPVVPSPDKVHNDLQLLTFWGVTPTPMPSTPPTTHGCTQSEGVFLNTESEILQGFDPGPGGTAVAGGKIRVWIKDERPPFISPNEVVDANTGAITTPGDHTAVDNGTDGEGNFYWEPTLYVVPPDKALNSNQVYCDSHTTGCTPHFPNVVKGDYNTANNFTGTRGFMNSTGGAKGPAPDNIGNFQNGPNVNGSNPHGWLSDSYFAEYIWNVDSLGLKSGSYIAQFSIHDGDINLAIDCFSIKL